MKIDSVAKKIRLVLADVDGTLVTKDKILTDRARKAVLRLGGRDLLFRHYQRPSAARDEDVDRAAGAEDAHRRL